MKHLTLASLAAVALTAALARLETAGNPPDLIVSLGSCGSRVLEQFGARMVSRDFRPGVEAWLHHKDFGLILAEAAALGAPSRGGSASMGGWAEGTTGAESGTRGGCAAARCVSTADRPLCARGASVTKAFGTAWRTGSGRRRCDLCREGRGRPGGRQVPRARWVYGWRRGGELGVWVCWRACVG